MWIIWDKKSNINGMSADVFLANNKHLQSQETIYLKVIDDKVVEIEGKSILAKVYDIDISLADNIFISQYEYKLQQVNSNTKEEQQDSENS